ncbi:MAG: hypothetical protein J6X30_01730 [Clostridia bacterium]|nr:hypothetical protein [Clostridia bacterium]
MFFRKKKKQEKIMTTIEIDLRRFDKLLEFRLDQIMLFLQIYKIACGGSYCLSMHSEIYHASGGLLYTDNGVIVFKIELDSWREGLLRGYPNVEDYMMSVFTFNADDRSFNGTMPAGYTSGRLYPLESLNEILQQSLDKYEAKHPDVHFQREKTGARMRN